MAMDTIYGIEMNRERKPTEVEELVIKEILSKLLDTHDLDGSYTINADSEGLVTYEGRIYASVGEVTICIWHETHPSIPYPVYLDYKRSGEEDWEKAYQTAYDEYQNQVVSTPIFHMQMSIRAFLRKTFL